MKNKSLLLVFMILWWNCSGESDKQRSEGYEDQPKVPSSAETISFVRNEQPSAELLIQKSMEAFQQGDKDFLKRSVVSAEEYSGLFDYLPENDGNPNTRKMMTSLFGGANRKHMNRWLDQFRENAFKEIQIVLPEKIVSYGNFELHKGVSLSALDASGKRQKIIPFKTLLKTDDGFKIWSFMDPGKD
jgi:hypothetical protein